MSAIDDSGWRPVTLFVSHLAALLLFFSWLIEPTRSLWLALDTQSFWAMNNSLAWGESWQTFWAIANNRAFDLVSAFAMFSLFAWPALVSDRVSQRRYIAMVLMLLITVLIFSPLARRFPLNG